MVIADTPWYSDERSGAQMLEERRALFIRRYGFPSDELNSLEFLTDQRLDTLEQRFRIQWQTHSPFYGVRWHMRPLWRGYAARANHHGSGSTPPRW